jgi:hypothetical protein
MSEQEKYGIGHGFAVEKTRNHGLSLISAYFPYFESSKEIQPGIIADYDEKGEIVGIEILHVSKRAMPPLKQAA